ncbi:hypothetical protein, partial [Streptomyces anulatus]|uniref:hypothetical protein n=1 Tax=Streptomyces anulatus TaxID=1892 RepID=UPI00369E5D28
RLSDRTFFSQDRPVIATPFPSTGSTCREGYSTARWCRAPLNIGRRFGKLLARLMSRLHRTQWRAPKPISAVNGGLAQTVSCLAQDDSLCGAILRESELNILHWLSDKGAR